MPATTVRGEVVHTDGSPVAEARVTLVGTAEGAKTSFYEDRTGSDGRFELNGVHPALYRAEASQGRLRSGIEMVQVSEVTAAPRIVLVLRDSWILKGKVVSGSRPVPAASMWPLPFTAQGTWAVTSVTATRSAIDGSFALDMPNSARMARIITLAPGFALQASTATRQADEPSEDFLVKLAPHGGTLRLARPSQKGVIVVNGVPIDVGFLTQWAAMNGQPPVPGQDFLVPAMPAGAYGYCDLSVAEAMAVIAGVAVPTSDACVSGFLSDGDTLALAPPPR